MPPRPPQDPIVRFVKAYHRGFICQSELWSCIFDQLSPETAGARLAGLPPETKTYLRSLERPSALLSERLDDDVRRAFARWWSSELADLA